MLKICLVGGSGHYRYVLDALKELNNQVCLVGVAPGIEGENLTKLEAQLSQLRIQPGRYTRWQTMLDVERPNIVVVNTHFGEHARINIECLQRGIHVFSEKPLATQLHEIRQLRTVHQESGKVLSAMFGIRYQPWFLAAFEAILLGRIGKVRQMQAQKSYKLGRRENFYHHRKSYGSTIAWVGSHAIDWLHWLSGERFVSIYAAHSRRDNSGHGELEATAQCQFVMSNEVLGSVSIDYLRPDNASTHDDDRIRIVGSHGILEVREQQVFLLNDEQDGIQILPLSAARFIFTDFVGEVIGKKPCMVSAEDALTITEICLLARESADKNRIFTLNEPIKQAAEKLPDSLQEQLHVV